MEVKYELTPEDVWHYQGYYRRRKVGLRSIFVYLLFGLAGIVCVGSSFVVWETWSRSGKVEWNTLLPLLAGIFVALCFLPPSKARMTKTYRQRPGVFARHTYQISPEWLSQLTPVSESKNAWASLFSLEEDESYLYYFLTKSTAYIIPKRAFTSYGEAQAFLNMSRHYWEAAKTGTLSAAEPEGIWPPAPRPGAG